MTRVQNAMHPLFIEVRNDVFGDRVDDLSWSVGGVYRLAGPS